MEQIKIETTHLTEIQKIKESYESIAFNLGKIELKLLELNNLKESLYLEFEEIKKTESAKLAEIEAKYGSGKLNLTTGIFERE